MKLWATNEACAKSKFWYFLRKLKKVKKSNGQVLAINEWFLLNSPPGLIQFVAKALQANVVGWCFASVIELVFLVLPKPYDCNFVSVLSRDKSSLATLLIIHAGESRFAFAPPEAYVDEVLVYVAVPCLWGLLESIQGFL
ncbi:unnamed protein product [Prunus armeniaca]